jgi:glycine/D-amino acid oxidase-like deaminating enzyme
VSGMEAYDRLVIGAGFFGLHGAYLFGRAGMRVAILDAEGAPMLRASQINQARVHNGYHYPRSVTTARSSAEYYDRFTHDFSGAINREFTQVYAVAGAQSLISANGFLRFCEWTGIPAVEIDPDIYFDHGTVLAAYETSEYSFDAGRLRHEMCQRLARQPAVDWYAPARIASVEWESDAFVLRLMDGRRIRARGVLNATYAGINQILRLFDVEPLPLKYELCEVILVTVEDSLRDVGLTLMDGPYFSCMPWGYSGYHSLTAVSYTPHLTSRDTMPRFEHQRRNPNCNDSALDNCAFCPQRPPTAWPFMRGLARRYVGDRHGIAYAQSLYSMKTVLARAEIDDARPTMVEEHSSQPWLTSILSGKIGTIYDLDEVL